MSSSFYGGAYSPFAFGIMSVLFPLFIILMLWTIVVKGFALWHAARHEQKEWFIALLVINTLGILDVIYLVWFRPSSTHYHKSRKSDTPTHESSGSK
jgi:hypothetical protein